MDLKDCPFCGSKCGTNITANGKSYYSFCPNCMSCSDIFDDHDDAVKAWNLRTAVASNNRLNQKETKE